MEAPVFQDPTKEAFYRNLIAKGESPRLAEMLAARQAPGIGMTDSIFLQGRWNGGIGDEQVAELYRSRARAAGVNPEGKAYCSQLASYPGDPRAWVDSVADVKRVAGEKGLQLEGGINYTPPGFETGPVDAPPSTYKVDQAIVEDHLKAELANTPTEVLDEYKAHPEKLADRKEALADIFSGSD